MEWSLHRQLKNLFAGDEQPQEVRLGKFRIDAVDRNGQLVEIQCASLAAIRSKILQLCKSEQVRVVKPLVASKTLLTEMTGRAGKSQSRRRKSPTHERPIHVFDDLVHFTEVFPHANLTLELALVEIEERRRPTPVRQRRRWRSHVVVDRKLVRLVSTHTLKTGADLRRLLPDGLPSPFDTRVLAEKADIPRWLAQKVAYCLRKMNVVIPVQRKRGWLYDWAPEARAA